MVLYDENGISVTQIVIVLSEINVHIIMLYLGTDN